MTLLRNLSVIWGLFHVLVLFVFIYDFRYPLKKTLILTGIFMAPLAVFNSVCYVHFGPERYAQLVIFLGTIPSLIFFFCMAKKPYGKFLFTFCLSDTVSMEIVVITKLLDFFLPGEHYVVMFITRLIAFPLLEFWVIKYFRKPYIKIQNQIKQGWWISSFVAELFYILIILESSVPVIITDRLEYLPHILTLMVLMPLVYFSIFFMLYQQLKRSEAEKESNILMLNAHAIEKRAEDIKDNEEKILIQRHDMRHRLNTVASMIQEKHYAEALDYINLSNESLSNIEPEIYCQNPVLNAVISYYFQKAKAIDIHIEHNIALPNEIPINTTDLSTVFANALENAIHACADLPKEKRIIKCKCISYPNLIFSISNAYKGTITVDEDGFPVSGKPEHGIGTRSIKAFCKKYNTTVDYKITDEYVDFRMAVFAPEDKAM